MPDSNWPYASSMSEDRHEIRYLSPSTLMSADPETSEGCLRKFWYSKVGQDKEEERDWQTYGKLLHAANEHYLRTGDDSKLDALGQKGKFMLPLPQTADDRIMIEWEIGGGDLATAPLRAAGIPIVGFIDCIHWRETNTGTNDVTEIYDPPGTIEVLDWKTTAHSKYIKSAQEVSRTLQMTTYGKWAVDVGGAEYVRLSHGYYVTKQKALPRKVSLLVHKDDINQRWEYVERLAGLLKEVARETDPDRVKPNTNACEAFRGCPYLDRCSAGMDSALNFDFLDNNTRDLDDFTSLDSLVGPNTAASLLGIQIPPVQRIEARPGTTPMSELLNKLKKKTEGKDLQAEARRLQLEEIDIKYPGAASAIKELDALGLGMPQLSGEAARVYSVVENRALTDGAGLAGSGELGQYSFDDPSVLPDILAEAKEILSQRAADGAGTPVIPPAEIAPMTTSAFPTDAPDPIPSSLSEPESVEETPVTTAEQAIDQLADDAPKKAARKGGRKAGNKKTDSEVEVLDNKAGYTEEQIQERVEQIQAQEPKPGTPEYRETMPIEMGAATATIIDSQDHTRELCVAKKGINLFVDCIPSIQYKSFWPIVDEICGKMAAEFKGKDYRTCDPNGPAGYGRHKGILAQTLREYFKRGMIADGDYVLDGASTETGQTVAEAMREICERSGGLFVRGIR